MTNFESLLEYLRERNAEITKKTGQGLSINSIEKFLITNGLKVNKDILYLYRIANGTDENISPLGMQYLFPGNIFLPLHKGIELYQEECITYQSWKEGLLPIFWNGNRDYLLIDCLNSQEGVFYFSPDDFRSEDPLKKYDSLELMFSTILDCFKNKAYSIGNRIEDIVYKREDVIEISSAMNPQSDYWKF